MRTLQSGLVLAPLIVLAPAMVGTSCSAHAPRGGARAVAVVPVDTLAVAETEGEQLRVAVERQLASGVMHRPLPRAELGELDPGHRGCRESEPCLAEAARRVSADLVLSMSIARLGSTRLVRSRLIDAKAGLVLNDLQETLTGEPPALDPFAQSLGRRLFPDSEPPWSRRWLGWTLLGVAVAGAAGTAVAVLAMRAGENDGVLHLGGL